MKKIYLFTLLLMVLQVTASFAQPAIYSDSRIDSTGVGMYETWKCYQGPTQIWTDSIYSSYSWSTGDTTPMITLTATGPITLTVGGGGSSTVEVFQDQLLNQTNIFTSPFGEDFCDGDVVEVQTFVDPGNWVLWSWGDTVFSTSDCDVDYGQGCGMIVNNSGVYSYVRYNAGTGCFFSSFPAFVTFHSNPVATISQSGDTLYANTPGASAFQWYDGTQTSIPNATNAWYQPLVPDSYYVEAANAHPGGSCTGPLSGATYWSSNCIASYYHYPDTSSQYSITIVNTSIPIPGSGVSFLWDFGDGNTSTQAYPQHQYTGPGTYNVCVTVSNGSCSHTYCDNIQVVNKVTAPFSINVVDPLTVGIEKPDLDLIDFRVWPQPVDGVLALTFSLEGATKLKVTMYDLRGRKVKTMPGLEMESGLQKIDLDCTSLTPGLYTIHFQAGDQNLIRKIAVQH